ncbi:MAG: hypothetical protein NTW26_01970 [bacterium]|nr:hypothetical protein [bacterium]
MRWLVLAFAFAILAIVPFVTSCGYSNAELKEYDVAKVGKVSADKRLKAADDENASLKARIEQKDAELVRAKENLAQKKAAYEEWEASR